MMEQNETTNWKQTAIKERALRQQAEQKLQQQTLQTSNAQQSARKHNHYNEFLENKYRELEAKCATQEQKLLATISMLKKARLLIQQRKIEIEMLNEKIAELNQTIEHKDGLLTEEIFLHEQTTKKLSTNISKLTQVNENNKQLQSELDKLKLELIAATATFNVVSHQRSDPEHTAVLPELTAVKADLILAADDLDNYFVYKALEAPILTSLLPQDLIANDFQCNT
jgi:chromosome segregation ATPase